NRFAAAVLMLASASCMAAVPAPDPATATAAQFFGLDNVYNIHLIMTADEYQKLEPSGPSMARPGVSGDDRYPTSTAILEFEGKRWGQINLRYKGNSSYRSGGSLKRPIKLEFDRAFFGMSKINLNNNAMDQSQMREALGYDIFRREGVPAARTAFARVWLTVKGTYQNQYAGLYTVVEQIDQTFFKDRFGSKTGVVLKPESLNGMPYLGGNWESYVVPYGAKSTTKIDPAAAGRFIQFTKFVKEASDEQFAKHVADYVDVDEFLRFLAVEVMTVNLDSPLGFSHNYYITINPKTQKVVWIPWDLNLAFGGFGGGRGRSAGYPPQDLSINKPSQQGQFPLADRVLAVPPLLAQYDEIVRNLIAKNFTVDRLSAEMKLMEDAISPALKDDRAVSASQFERNMSAEPSAVALTESEQPAQNGFGRGFGRSMGGPPLRQFIALRAESAREQLDGKREGFTAPGRGARGGRGFFGPPGGGPF
ncbi:MAG TPA: CotH kinase family protein, partial [Bryobacteraceae bacterium]|nr:CotH kinase family protein [Bryobacteraceae bacterium]